MVARRYKISLRVLRSISLVRCASVKHQPNTKLFHFNSFFSAKGAIYYAAIVTEIFSHVKISSFWNESSPGIS